MATTTLGSTGGSAATLAALQFCSRHILARACKVAQGTALEFAVQAAMSSAYVHGYGPGEVQRLQDQAQTLIEFIHADTAYQVGATILEAGCGVGAQTVSLATRSPGAHFISIDHSASSLARARDAVAALGLSNVSLQLANIFDLPFAQQSFDHVFVCFVLEHLARPLHALWALKRMLKPGGTITMIEGDHGSAYFHPDSDYARSAIHCLATLQAQAGGDAMIGRRLFPLLVEAGFSSPKVSPRLVYVDASKPALIDGFTRKTFTAMIEGIRREAIEAGLLSRADFDRAIADLNRTAEPDGVFCYTFFKAVAVNR